MPGRHLCFAVTAAAYRRGMAGNRGFSNGDHAAVPVLSGRALRFVLVEHIERHGTMSVAEMVTALAEHGFVLTGRASKVISDALRWEVARGRVVRICRGVYSYGRPPRSTARRIRLFGRQCLAWITAVRRGHEPPPTPRTPKRRWPPHMPMLEDPLRPPWPSLEWLWDR